MADYVVEKSRQAGASAADVVIAQARALDVTYRQGRLEDTTHAQTTDLGLRVFINNRSSLVSSTDMSATALQELVARAMDMAQLAPPDPYCGLADKQHLAKTWPNLDLDDATTLDVPRLSDRAREMESCAYDVKGVTNSEGASAGWSHSCFTLATSEGFVGSQSFSSHGLSCSVIAGKGSAMETDYDGHHTRHFSDLRAPSKIGTRAGERAVAKLNPSKARTLKAPVIFDARVSRSLLGHFAQAVSGTQVARGTTFLKDSMKKKIFPSTVVIMDDPHRLRGLSSRPFDDEGVKTQPIKLVDDGVLATWLLDSTSARQLSLTTTGHAARSVGGVPYPSASNLFMQAGTLSKQALMEDIQEGFYVTGLIGMGVNGVTGDYSRGAYGFWIEKGQCTYPVNEITIAGNLKDMFQHLTPADDLAFHYGVNAPCLRVEGMTIAAPSEPKA